MKRKDIFLDLIILGTISIICNLLDIRICPFFHFFGKTNLVNSFLENKKIVIMISILLLIIVEIINLNNQLLY